MNREDEISRIREKYRLEGRSLNEAERRHWAAVEALEIGWGGISLVSEAIRISPNTIKKGIGEISSGQAESDGQANGRIRKSGGGRKSKKGMSGIDPEASLPAMNQPPTVPDQADSDL